MRLPVEKTFRLDGSVWCVVGEQHPFHMEAIVTTGTVGVVAEAIDLLHGLRSELIVDGWGEDGEPVSRMAVYGYNSLLAQPRNRANVVMVP